jgi:serine/threonine protein kinase
MPHYGAIKGVLLGKRYRVQKELGAGAFGEVYLASQETLGTQDSPGFEFRKVALKLFINKYVTPGNAAKTFREAMILEQLNSKARARGEVPHVVSVHEIGVFDDYLHTPYVAMELIDGGCLEDQLRLSPALPVVVKLLRQICAGVKLAHENGIYHLDLKPANVLMAKNGFLKVSDFGVAIDRHEAFRLTGLPGTISYSAPETGLRVRETGASDVYSMGLMLIELLLTRNPLVKALENAHRLELDHRPGLADAQKLLAQLRDPETSLPLSVLELRRDPSMAEILKRCLAMDARERFKDAGALDAALEAWQQGIVEVPAPPPQPTCHEALQSAAGLRARGDLDTAEQALRTAEGVCDALSPELSFEWSKLHEARGDISTAISRQEEGINRSVRSETALLRLSDLYRAINKRASDSLREEAKRAAKRK